MREHVVLLLHVYDKQINITRDVTGNKEKRQIISFSFFFNSVIYITQKQFNFHNAIRVQ